MNGNFWTKLPRPARTGDPSHSGGPFFVLAPMADVTDAALRRLVARIGKPDVLWTEFVSADGLMSGGREVLKKDLIFTEAERPIVAQLFGSKVETIRGAVKMCVELGFDGVDINMGCPDKTIEKQGAGAATIKTPEVAAAIIAAAKAGIADAGKDIPLSVKTRIGYNTNELETWIPFLLRQNLAALTVHLRTRKEMSSVPAHWELMSQIVKLRDELAPDTVIIGNGDVVDMNDAREKARATGCDGVMIGRAIFGNPWLFAKKDVSKKHSNILKNVGMFFQKYWFRLLQKLGFKNRYWLRQEAGVSREEKLRVLVEHCKLFSELLGDVKSFAVMKKHFKAYVHGWDGAKELRMKLMETSSAGEVEEVINSAPLTK